MARREQEKKIGGERRIKRKGKEESGIEDEEGRRGSGRRKRGNSLGPGMRRVSELLLFAPTL